VAVNPQGFAWVANEGTSTSTLYDGNGVRQALVVTIPAGTAGPAHPPGIVLNPTGSFPVSQGMNTSTSVFIFAELSGTISGRAPSVNATAAVIAIDRAAAGSAYTGPALALATGANGPRLYAAISRTHGSMSTTAPSRRSPVQRRPAGGQLRRWADPRVRSRQRDACRRTDARRRERHRHRRPVGLGFGDGLNAQPVNTRFFAAGPANETHGAYGRIDVQ
jgi:hypothetical protein